MSWLNALLRSLFDALLYPFRELHPWVGLTLLSLVTGVAVLLVFKATSNQERLAEVKRKIHAGLFEIRLYNDDLRAILRAQNEILRSNLRYLWHSLPPMLWIIPPLFLVLAQLHFHYGYRGLEPGDPALLTVKLKPGAEVDNPKPPLRLEVPEGLRLDSAGVWAPSLRETTWRLVAEEPGDYRIGVGLGGESWDKSVRVSEAVVRRSPLRPSGLLDQLLYPAEPPLPAASPIESIALDYPDTGIGLFAMPTWMWVFFILSLIFAFALRNRLGVTI